MKKTWLVITVVVSVLFICLFTHHFTDFFTVIIPYMIFVNMRNMRKQTNSDAPRFNFMYTNTENQYSQ